MTLTQDSDRSFEVAFPENIYRKDVFSRDLAVVLIDSFGLNRDSFFEERRAHGI